MSKETNWAYEGQKEHQRYIARACMGYVNKSSIQIKCPFSHHLIEDTDSEKITNLGFMKFEEAKARFGEDKIFVTSSAQCSSCLGNSEIWQR